MKREAKYLQLFETIKEEIVSGAYRGGNRIPGENELSRKYKMSRQTVRQSLSLLEQEGLVERRQGSGTYVLEQMHRRKRTWNVGVVTTYISEYIFPGILRGIERELSQGGFSPLLFATANRVDNERRILEEFLKRPVDGLIVEATKSALPNPNIGLYRALMAQGIPVVFFNGWYQAMENPVYVVMDDKAGGSRAVSMLADAGHRYIGGIFKSDDRQGLERYAGYLEGALERGLSVKDHWVLWFQSENRRQFLTEEGEWLRRTMAECTAVVCYNDEVAVRLAQILKEKGYKLPEERMIASFDNSLYSQISPIYSLDHPKEVLGATAARKLMALIGGKKEKSLVLSWGAAIPPGFRSS